MVKLKTVSELLCQHCRHTWFPQRGVPPKVCPRCKCYVWGEPHENGRHKASRRQQGGSMSANRSSTEGLGPVAVEVLRLWRQAGSPHKVYGLFASIARRVGTTDERVRQIVRREERRLANGH